MRVYLDYLKGWVWCRLYRSCPQPPSVPLVGWLGWPECDFVFRFPWSGRLDGRPAAGRRCPWYRRSMVGLTGGVWGMIAIGPKITTAAPHPPTYLLLCYLPTSVVV